MSVKLEPLAKSILKGAREMVRELAMSDATFAEIRKHLADEHIATSDLASDHFAAQLIERIGWALVDAESTERTPAARPG